MNKQKRLCKTCANLDGDECKVMLARPTELWCWADIKTQRMRELGAILHMQSGAYLGKCDPKTIRTHVDICRNNLKRLHAMRDAEEQNNATVE